MADSPAAPHADDAGARELARFAALADLAHLLPYQRRDALSGLLSDADVATLRHLAARGMGANTLRALAADLAFLERWALAATGAPLPWPAPAELVAMFLAHCLWDPARRAVDVAHGMPAGVAAALRAAGALQVEGPHAPATVARRLAHWASLHRARGLAGPFGEPQLKTAIRLAMRAADRPPARKSEKAIVAGTLEAILAAIRLERLIDLRDRALLLVAFAAGGRRRSEIAGLRCEDVETLDPVPADPADPSGGVLPCRRLRLRRTKTTDASDDAAAFLTGRPVAALDAWLTAARIVAGPVFRPVDQWGHVGAGPLSPQAVNLIVKRRAAAAGLDPGLYSAHGLRSGFLTEAAAQGVPLPEAMAQSQHRSVQQAARYYNDANRQRGKAARLLG